MANKKISELPVATTPSGNELVEIVQGGVNKKITTQEIADLNRDYFRGVYTSEAALLSAVPTAEVGDYAEVDEGSAYDTIFYIWDVDSGWVVASSPVGISADDVTETATRKFVSPAEKSTWNGKQDALGFTPENSTNKATSFSTINNTLYPTTQAVNTYVVGLQDIFIPAAAMWPRVTGGSSDLTRTEIVTSLVNIQTLDFDQTTQEFAQFTISLPRNWNNSTVTAKIYWTADSGTGTVVWGVSGGAYSNDDALTVALGTAQTVSDTLIAQNDLHITDVTSAITLAGTPADADFLAFQVSRNPADGSDTLNADAKLIGIVITITTDSPKAA